MTETEKTWFGVRCVFVMEENKPWGPTDLREGELDYEERVTIWHAASAEEAIELAEQEALDYAADLECEYAGLAQSYAMADDLEHGAEVFSLIRRSTLEVDDYVTRFFDTGRENGRSIGPD